MKRWASAVIGYSDTHWISEEHGGWNETVDLFSNSTILLYEQLSGAPKPPPIGVAHESFLDRFVKPNPLEVQLDADRWKDYSAKQHELFQACVK